MSVNPSKLVLDEIYNRLEDSTDGFNAIYNSIAPGYGLPPVMGVDFSSSKTPSFCFGDISMADWLESSPRSFPLIALFTRRVVSDNHEKFHAFSGLVFVAMNVFLSWKGNAVIRDFDFYSQAVEETVLTIINRARPEYSDDQNWNTDVAYNGQVELVKSGILRDNDAWVQQMAFTFTFMVDADL